MTNEGPIYNVNMTDLKYDSSCNDEMIAEQAVSWFARLRAEDITNDEITRFTSWYQASLAHRQAYDEIVAFWDDADFVQALADCEQISQVIPLPPPRFKHLKIATLALAACLVSVAVIYRPYLRCLGADYCTGVGEIRTVALADGSQITLNSDTAIRFDLRDDRRYVRLQHGEAFFDVSRNPQQPFLVDARFSTTRVLGTRFIVREEADRDSVTVISGLVEVSNDRQKTALLKANENITVNPEQTSDIRSVSAINATAWLKGYASFDNVPLSKVIAEINRYRHGGILIKDKALKDLKVSGRFDIIDTDKALEALQQTLPIRIYGLTPWLVIIS